MTPAQESAIRRWCTHARLSPITPTTWAWLLTMDSQLRDFLTWPDERLAAHCAAFDEAPDGPELQLSRRRWWQRVLRRA